MTENIHPVVKFITVLAMSIVFALTGLYISGNIIAFYEYCGVPRDIQAANPKNTPMIIQSCMD